LIRDFDGIGARGFKDRDRDSRLVVEQRHQRVAGCVHFHARHISQPGDLTLRSGLDDDVAELFFRHQPALRIDGQEEVASRGVGRRT